MIFPIITHHPTPRCPHCGRTENTETRCRHCGYVYQDDGAVWPIVLGVVVGAPLILAVTISMLGTVMCWTNPYPRENCGMNQTTATLVQCTKCTASKWYDTLSRAW